MPEKSESVGTTSPTPDRVETAQRLRSIHQRVNADDGHCWWCDYPWPCPTVRWIARVLARASGAGRRS